jgi:hypothetical protein
MPELETEVAVPPSPEPPPTTPSSDPTVSPTVPTSPVAMLPTPATTGGSPTLTEMTPGTSIDNPADAPVASESGTPVPAVCEPTSTPIRSRSGSAEATTGFTPEFTAPRSVSVAAETTTLTGKSDGGELDEGAATRPPRSLGGMTSRATSMVVAGSPVVNEERKTPRPLGTERSSRRSPREANTRRWCVDVRGVRRRGSEPRQDPLPVTVRHSCIATAVHSRSEPAERGLRAVRRCRPIMGCPILLKGRMIEA